MKKETILIITIPILCAIAAILSYVKLVNTDVDAIKFKKEYESLNEKGSIEINIDKNNPIEYADYDKLLEVIENGTGIIYLGFPECPWCRNALPVLFDVAKDNDVEVIYYMNILNERDSYVVEDGKLVYATDKDGNEKKGSEGYFKLLDALDEHLSDYVILFEDEEYETGEKRIYAPTVIFVRDGEVLGLHVSTVDSQENPKEALTQNQYDELYSIYEDYLTEIESGTCSIGTSC